MGEGGILEEEDSVAEVVVDLVVVLLLHTVVVEVLLLRLVLAGVAQDHLHHTVPPVNTDLDSSWL